MYLSCLVSCFFLFSFFFISIYLFILSVVHMLAVLICCGYALESIGEAIIMGNYTMRFDGE